MAYADFVTAMMAFFMVMWITAQNKQMKAAVAHYFNDPFNSESKTKGPNAAGSTTTGPFMPGSKTLLPSLQAGRSVRGQASQEAPKPTGRKVEEAGPKLWAGEGTRSAGVGKPTLFVLNNGNSKGMAPSCCLASSEELDEKAKEQLNQILPLLRGSGRRSNFAAMPDNSCGGRRRARCLAVVVRPLPGDDEISCGSGDRGGSDSPESGRSNEPHTILEGAENRTQNSCVDISCCPSWPRTILGRAKSENVDSQS